MTTQCAIIIVGYNSVQYLPDCMESLFADTGGQITRNVVFVDNASSDASIDYIKQNYPQVHTVRSDENLGFAGGNNLGWEYIRQNLADTKYVVLLNPDTIASEGWLEGLMDVFDRFPKTGIAQSKLMLWPEKSKINSAGNSCHYLGYGFVNGYGDEDTEQFNESVEIGFASGAACMISVALLEKVGMFDPEFFMYCEDTDLSWKVRLAGFGVRLAPKSVVYHKYSFQKNFRFYYYLERNRAILILSFYRLWTLLLITPMMLLMEAGQWYFSLRNKKAGDKLKAFMFFLKPSGIAYMLKRRKQIQNLRTISDRAFTAPLVSRIRFSELQSPLLKYIANPIMRGWWAVVRFLIV